jgi:DNA-binding LytR/AlgR family response regulator
MIKVLIIEDEIPARKKLKRFINELETTIDIVEEIDTVEAAIDFLKNKEVDLIFSDIELLDGNAFEIYKTIPVNCPIIFTTAYDQFWMNAFESNGIEYLLKPFSKERFQKAWNKFVLLRKIPSQENILLSKLQQLLDNNLPAIQFKKRFTVNAHQGIYFLDIESITFFEANEGVVFAFDNSGKKHLINETTLKDVEAQLSPLDFFRINRSELINKKHLEKIERYNKNTLAVKLKGQERYLKTSQNTTAAFREWIKN